MIVIWKGVGGMVILIGIGACVLMNIITDSLFTETSYFQKHMWPQLVALWLTGLACWLLGRYVNGKPSRTLIDKATGREVVVKPYHHLMFIKVEYWGIIFLIIGLVRIAWR